MVEITETGRALAAAGLRIVGTLLESCTELMANPAAAADPVKRHAMTQLLTLLQGTLEARGKVLLKLNVPRRPSSTASSPSCPRSRRPPSPSSRAATGFAVETVVPKSEVNILIPALKDKGATDIIELPLSKIVH